MCLFLTCVMLQGLCPVAAKALTSLFSINLHGDFFYLTQAFAPPL